MTLSLAKGARPYYTFSLKIKYPDDNSDIELVQDVLHPTQISNPNNPIFNGPQMPTDWMNIVFTVNHGCVFILNSDTCHKRFLDMWHYCTNITTVDGWYSGGMLNDTCSQFYITAGAELKGYLWDFPLSDMIESAGWR
jgi:hypothetical protein